MVLEIFMNQKNLTDIILLNYNIKLIRVTHEIK
jgi:hypothetical protein